MADLRELTTDAKRLYEALDYLLEKQEESNTGDIDFKEIWFSAKARPFEQHMLGTMEEHEAKRYLSVLSALIALTENGEKRTIQIRFLARLLAACKQLSLSLESIVSEGKIIENNIIDELQEIDQDEVLSCMFIDLFLLTYLDGNVEQKQLDFAVGFMSLFGIARDKTEAIANIVKGILEQNDLLVLDQAQYVNPVNIYCYMKNPPDGVLVWDLETAKEIDAKKIIFKGVKFQAVSQICCDDFQAEIVEFSECQFIGIGVFENKTKKVIISHCVFEKIEVRNNFMRSVNTHISDCEFKDLTTYGLGYAGFSGYINERPSLIILDASEITNTKFMDIVLKFWNSENTYGGMIVSRNTTIKDSSFCNISAMYGSGWRRYNSTIITLFGGRIYKSQIKEWNFDSPYLCGLGLYDEARQSEIELQECHIDGYSDFNWWSPDIAVGKVRDVFDEDEVE